MELSMSRELQAICQVVVIFMAVSTFAMADESLQGLGETLDALDAHDPVARAEALRDIGSLRARIGKRMIEKIQAGLQRPDNAYNGTLHVSIVAVGDWRIEDAVPLLVKHVDFVLDPQTFPVGARRAASAYYPMAEALVRIQGTILTERVLELFQEPISETKLRAATWVLSQSLDRNAAKNLLDGAIEHAEMDVAIEQLSAARSLLNELEILQYPQLKRR
jgi:hypothetical protein